jgi:DNA-binding transcriptional ArsR family regulator
MPERLLKALADPTCRMIFERLARDGEQTVHALTGQARVSQPAVSRHLGVLKLAGLVRDRRAGRETHYRAQLGALAPRAAGRGSLRPWSRYWRASTDAGEATVAPAACIPEKIWAR